MLRMKSLVPLSILIIASALLSYAQVTNVTDDVAVPSPGVGHDYLGMLNETVNPANGSLSIRVALPIPKGRGLTLPFSIAYDSNGQYVPVDLGNSQMHWTGNTSWIVEGGWTYTVPNLTELSASMPGDAMGHDLTCPYSVGYMFNESGGERHAFYLSAWQPGGTVPICQEMDPQPVQVLQSGDTQVFATLPTPTTSNGPYLPVTVWDADGTTYSFSSENLFFLGINGSASSWATALPATVEDRNGNVLTYKGQSNGAISVVDTAGRPVISTSGFGVSGNTVSVAGVNSPYTLYWQSTPAGSYNAGAVYVGGAGSNECISTWPIVSTQTTAVSNIVLPNGQQYTFYYDSGSGFINKIVYPTGGWVQYTWQQNTASEMAELSDVYGQAQTCFFHYGLPVIVKRQVSFNGSTIAEEQDFSYTTNWSGSNSILWTTKTTTVTTKDLVRGGSFQTQYTYAPFDVSPQPNDSAIDDVGGQVPLESQIIYYDWDGSIRETVNKTWANQYELTSVQTTAGASGPTSQVVYKYGNWAAQVVEKDEYDFGQSSPTRQTITNYQPFASTAIESTINDRPCQVIVYDNTKTRVAETDYYYDGGTSLCTASTPSSVAGAGGSTLTGHDETNYGVSSKTCSGQACPRGNVTQKTQWLNTGSSPVTTYAYDETGQVTSMTDPRGNTTTYSYADSFLNTNSTGFTTTAGAPPTGDVTNAYLTRITYPTTNKIAHVENFSYGYNDGELTQSTDENTPPNKTTYKYNDSLGRLTETDYPDNGQTMLAFNDSAPSVTTCQLINGTAGATCSSTTPQPGWKTTLSTMNGLGQVVQTELVSDPDGPTYTATAYDGEGRVYESWNPTRCSPPTTNCGTETTWGYTTYTYDALGRTTQVQEQDNSVVRSFYDETCIATTNGLGTTVIDEAGNSRKSCSDGLGRLVEVDEPGTGPSGPTPGSGQFVVSTVSNPQNCDQHSNGQGGYYYTPFYGVASITIEQTTVNVNWSGSCDGSGHQTIASADSWSQALTAQLNSSSAGVNATDLGNGTIQVVANTNGSETNYTISSSSTLSGGEEVLVSVSPSAGSLTGGSDGSLGSNPPVTLYSYDMLNNLTKVNQQGSNSANARVRTFTYDSLSRLVCAANPEVQSVTCPSTATGTYPSGAITYSYDADGNVATRVAPQANQFTTTQQTTTTYTYDGLNRVLQVAHANPSNAAASYSYDGTAISGCTGISIPTLSSPQNLIGRRSAMCTQQSTSSFSYDPMGRLWAEARSVGFSAPVTYTTGYTYWKDGSLDTLTYPSTDVVTYAVGRAGRVTQISDSNNTFVAAPSTPPMYTPNGALANMGQGSGITTNNIYNDRLQPILLSAGPTSGPVFSLCYDFHSGVAITKTSTDPCQFSAYTSGNNGNVFQVFDNLDSTRNVAFAYDSLNRITQANTVNTTSGNCWGETYTIDAWGNLTNIAAAPGMGGTCSTESLSAAPANVGNQLNGYTYDAAGNLLLNSTTNYNAENQLYNPAATYTYWYDADGVRARKAASATVGTMYWPGAGGEFLMETNGSGAINEEYIYFNGERIARVDRPSGTVHYYLSNHLGSHMVVTNATGACEQDIDYYPYGGVVTDHCPKVPQHYKFTGKERDTESGNDYFGARYYASSLGRFMVSDKAFNDQSQNDPQSWNLYGYVRNNPISFTDPTGNSCIQDANGNWVTVNDGGESCEQVDINTATNLTPSAQVTATPIDTLQDIPANDLANSVANLTTASSVSEVVVKGETYAGIALGIGEIANAISGAKAAAELAAARAAAGMIGGVSRAALEAAASGGGETVRLVTTLDSAPAAGRALSTATGEGADALAKAAGGGTKYVANIPKALVQTMEKAGLVTRSTTSMGSAVATELRFSPQATEFIVQFFHAVH